MIKYILYGHNHTISPVSYVLWDWAGTVIMHDSVNTIAYDYIHTFNSYSINQYIISNEQSLSKLINSVESVGLSNIFRDHIICVGHGYEPKPSRSMYNAFLGKEQSIAATEVVFIGDSESDSEFATNCGCHFIHISYINQYEIGKNITISGASGT